MKKTKFRLMVEKALQEAKRVGSLYHCTNIENALEILNTNVLFSARSLGVSTSRNLNLFKKGYGEVCIELDGDKLSNKYRILPMQYGREDSQEELIQDKKLTPYKSIEDYHTVHQTIGFKKFEQLDRDYWEYTGDPDIGFTIKGMSIPNILNYIKAIYITPKQTEYSSSTQVEELLKKCSALHIDIKLLDINTERTRAGGVMTKLPTTDRELYQAKGNHERAIQYQDLAKKTKVLYKLLQKVFPDIKIQISPNKDSYNFIIPKNAKSKNFDFNAYINENTIGEKNVLKIKENNMGYLLTFNPNSIILPSHIGLARIPTQFITYDLCLQKVSEEKIDGEKDNNDIKYVPKQFEDYKMFATALKHWHADLYQIPEQFKDKNMYLIEYSKYGELKVIPDKFKTYDLCLDAVNKHAYNLKAVPDQLKDQKICMLAFEKNSDMIEYIPDKFKTYDMCIKAVEDEGYNIEYIPEQFITQDLCLNIIKKNPHHIKYIPQKFKTYDMCLEVIKNVSDFYQWLYLKDEVPKQFKDKIKQELGIE